MNWMQIEAQRERLKDMLCEAERTHAVRRALAELPKKPGVIKRSLFRVGQQLVTWGEILERRYSVETERVSLAASDC